MQFDPGGLTYAQRLERDVERMKAARKKAAQRRKKRLGFDDPDAIVVKRKPGPKAKPKKPCTVESCERPQHGHRLCNTHLKQTRRARGLRN